MNTITISATAARNNFFDLLDQVAQGTQVIIKRDQEEIAVLTPKKTTTDWGALKRASQKLHGVLKGYSVDQLLPLRKKNAWKRLGNW